MIKKIYRRIRFEIFNRKNIVINSLRINRDKKQIKELKNIYKNQRCFIVGNGPSLKVDDLEKLHNEVCFATHRIYEIYDNTSWRPTYYCAQDSALVNVSANEISKKIKSKKIIGLFPNRGYKKIDNAIYAKIKYEEFYPELPKFSEDMEEGFYEGYTVSYMCLQMAMYMGFKEIYLLGIDHSYSVDLNPDGTVKRKNIDDHFSKNDIITALPQTYKSTLAYKSAKKYAESHGIKIYNATRGGCLEVYERVNFDSLFSKEEKL